jgi:hypothetical protein
MIDATTLGSAALRCRLLTITSAPVDGDRDWIHNDFDRLAYRWIRPARAYTDINSKTIISDLSDLTKSSRPCPIEKVIAIKAHYLSTPGAH